MNSGFMVSHKLIFLQSSNDSQGFTLLEVLLSIVVLGIVVAMVTMSLSGTVKIIDATETQGEFYHRARVAMLRMSEDIASALPRQKIPFTGEHREINGRNADFLQFVSMAHIDLSTSLKKEGEEGTSSSKRSLITYELQADNENDKELVLMRSDILSGQGKEFLEKGSTDIHGYILCDQLYSLQFTYFDKDDEEIDTWDSKKSGGGAKKLPRAVKITMQFLVDNEKEDVVEFTTEVYLPAAR